MESSAKTLRPLRQAGFSWRQRQKPLAPSRPGDTLHQSAMQTIHRQLPASSSRGYRREARRLRRQLRTRPVELYAALRQLSHHTDRASAENTAPAEPCTSSDRHQQFARLVEQELDGPVLRYSARTALIRHAMRSGIGRFEANLVIAAVQHRHIADGAGAQQPRGAVPATAAAGHLQTIAVAGVVQAVLIAIVWWTLLR
jgi:hypothetical protein